MQYPKNASIKMPETVKKKTINKSMKQLQ